MQINIEKFMQINILKKSMQADKMKTYLLFLNIYIYDFVYNKGFFRQKLIYC